MSDIFISYSSSDREAAGNLAEALAEHGWSVWWDRVIPPGRQFDEVIEEALDAARCVVVLWSKSSAASTWVKTEAAEAMRRKALIPAIIEEVKIPLEFRRLQAGDLSHWRGDRADPQLQHFFESIAAQIGPPGEAKPPLPINPEPVPAPPPGPAPGPVDSNRRSSRLSPVALGAIAAAVIAIVGAGLYYERSSSIERAAVAAREKGAAEAAERERERLAREQVEKERERTGRERTEKERAQAEEERSRIARELAMRKAAEARASRPSAAETPAAAEPQPPSRAQQGVPASGALNLQWRDHALAFNGRLLWNRGEVVLQASVNDLRTGIHIGNYSVPAIMQQRANEYIVAAQFDVPGDSATPGPHSHYSRLRLQAQGDGSLRFLQNCPPNGQCY